jgi:primosomal protein N'
MTASTTTAAPIAPSTKREGNAFDALSVAQQEAARQIAATADKLTAAVWKAAIEQAVADVAPSEPTTKRESAAWAELTPEQQDAARAIADSADKLNAFVWKNAIAQVRGDAEPADKTPSKSALAKAAREAKAAEAVANAEQFGTFTIADPAADDELFAVVLDDKHVVYTATNRRYVEVVRAALADGLAARVAEAKAARAPRAASSSTPAEPDAARARARKPRVTR